MKIFGLINTYKFGKETSFGLCLHDEKTENLIRMMYKISKKLLIQSPIVILIKNKIYNYISKSFPDHSIHPDEVINGI